MRFRFATSLGLLLAAAGLAPAEGPPDPPRPDAPTVVPAPAACSIDGPLACSPDCDRAPANRFWVGQEYLLWWIKDGPLPFPVVTTGDPNDPIPGALGQPGTRPLFGGNGLDYGIFSGLRVYAGAWLIADGTIGLEGSGFLLDRRWAASAPPRTPPATRRSTSRCTGPTPAARGASRWPTRCLASTAGSPSPRKRACGGGG